nr:MAG TPA: RNA dependent RNA polymerase [Picobirnaviridae sp.]
MEMESYFRKSFDLPNPDLENYFLRVVKGNDVEYRTPFYKGRPLSSLLKEWQGHLLQVADQWPTLYQFENDLAEKVGPMSIMKPLAERMSDIRSYYDSISLESKPLLSTAIAAVRDEWCKNANLTIKSQIHTWNDMKKSTSSGSPYFTKRKYLYQKTFPASVSWRGEHVFQTLANKEWNACAILGWRGQEGGPEYDDVKQRVVWMFPLSVNLRELQVYQPLISYCQTQNLIPAWVSMESVDQRITQLFDTKGRDDLIVCTDFTKFDQHFNRHLQSVAHILIESMFSDAAIKDWLVNVFPIKYMIPLACNYMDVMFGEHGMASGSGGTNADETLAHRVLQHEAAILSHAKLNPNSQCLGDDGILSYPGINVEDVTLAYSSHGLNMNIDKQYASALDCTYLRRWHHRDYRINDICVGVYSTCRALGRLCEQERYYDPNKWNAKMVALRQLSILENCKYHPLREEFVEWCMKGDRYRLGVDLPGFLDNIESEAKKAIDNIPDFLGYTRSLQAGKDPTAGIADWWIVKFLKSRA